MATLARGADPAADLAKFSVFEGFDLGKVSGGKVLAQRGPAADGGRDLAIQAVYLVEAPLAKVVATQRSWDPSRHSGQKVVLHGEVTGKPADFARLATLSGSSAAKSLAAASQKLPEKGPLQVSNAEAVDYPKVGQPGAFWQKVLLQRAQASPKGGQPYEIGAQSIRASDEAARLLKQQGKIRAQFQPVLGVSPLGGGGGAAAQYWELFEAEGQGAVTLGATYAKESGDSAQVLDYQYYASGGFYAYVTLYQYWSVAVEGKPATLVWRGDLLSSQALGELRGVEKMGSGSAMMKEVQKSIGFFQKDVR